MVKANGSNGDGAVEEDGSGEDDGFVHEEDCWCAGCVQAEFIDRIHAETGEQWFVE